MISFVRIECKIRRVVTRSWKFRTKYDSIDYSHAVYALSPCNHSFLIHSTILRVGFSKPRRPIPREFPPDLIARAPIHQTFQDLYFIFNIARVARVWYISTPANRVLSNHPPRITVVDSPLFAIDPSIFTLETTTTTSAPCIFLPIFHRIDRFLPPGNKYLFPWETRIINRSISPSPRPRGVDCYAWKLTGRRELLFNLFPIDG